jgi:hypothetical protein
VGKHSSIAQIATMAIAGHKGSSHRLMEEAPDQVIP